jgi:hypothetical protein
VIHTIKTEVGHDKEKLVKSYIQVLLRAFPVPLTAIWDQVSKELPLEAETIDNFNILLHQFFKAHSTDDDNTI